MRSIIAIAIIVLAMAGTYNAVAQGTGTTQRGMAVNFTGAPPNGSAILDVSSTTKGMLVPRMTSTQMHTISTPAAGLLVYATDSTPGFYFYNGTNWTSIS